MERLKFAKILERNVFTPLKNTILVNFNTVISKSEFFRALVLELIYIVPAIILFNITYVYSEVSWCIVNSIIAILIHFSFFSLLVRCFKTINKNVKFVYILFVVTLLRSLCAIYDWFYLVGYSPISKNFNFFEEIVNVYYYASMPFVYIGIIICIVMARLI